MDELLKMVETEHVARCKVREEMSEYEGLFSQPLMSGVTDACRYHKDYEYRGLQYRILVIHRFGWKYEPETNSIALNYADDDQYVFLEPTEQTRKLREIMDQLRVFEGDPFLWEDSGHVYNRGMTLRENWEWMEREAEKQVDMFWQYFKEIEYYLNQALQLILEVAEHKLRCIFCPDGKLEFHDLDHDVLPPTLQCPECKSVFTTNMGGESN
jgi:hypothetical protein